MWFWWPLKVSLILSRFREWEPIFCWVSFCFDDAATDISICFAASLSLLLFPIVRLLAAASLPMLLDWVPDLSVNPCFWLSCPLVFTFWADFWLFSKFAFELFSAPPNSFCCSTGAAVAWPRRLLWGWPDVILPACWFVELMPFF